MKKVKKNELWDFKHLLDPQELLGKRRLSHSVFLDVIIPAVYSERQTKAALQSLQRQCMTSEGSYFPLEAPSGERAEKGSGHPGGPNALLLRRTQNKQKEEEAAISKDVNYEVFGRREKKEGRKKYGALRMLLIEEDCIDRLFRELRIM